jgi:hypothetical protein
LVSVADERVVVWDIGECAYREVCADGECAVEFGVFIQYGAISKRGSCKQQYLDLLRLWRELDGENYWSIQELVFGLFILNGTISNRGGSRL